MQCRPHGAPPYSRLRPGGRLARLHANARAPAHAAPATYMNGSSSSTGTPPRCASTTVTSRSVLVVAPQPSHAPRELVLVASARRAVQQGVDAQQRLGAAGVARVRVVDDPVL